MLKISLVQFTPEFGQPDENLAQISSLLQGIETDIILLPELCTTGYSFLTKEEALSAAEEQDGGGINFFRMLAREYQAMVIAGYAEKKEGKVYNSAIVALPDGGTKIYQKTHLFLRKNNALIKAIQVSL